MSVYRKHELVPHLGLAEKAAPTSCTGWEGARLLHQETQVLQKRTSDCIPAPINKLSSLAEMAERGKRKVEDTGAKQQSLHRDSELPK